MGIRNSNIAANAAIDPAKVNYAFSSRTFHEDFDESTGGAEDLYGINQVVVGATETHTLDGVTSALITVPANNDAAMYVSSTTWSGNRHCIMQARVSLGSITVTVLNNIQIGWGDTVAVGSTATPIADQDWAYLEFNIANSPNWRLRTNVTGAAGGSVTVDTGVVATLAAQNLSVQILTGGTVIATVGDTVTRSAAGAVKVSATDWVWLTRLESDDATPDSQTLTIDTIAASEARTDFTA
jgi:hypothetical protein